MARRRARLFCGLLVLVAGSLAMPAARASAGSRVRVLVLEAAGPVRITDEDGRAWTLSHSAGRLLEGERPVGVPFTLEGPGPQGIDERQYRGGIEVLPTERGLAVVNEIDLEDYVAGCVAREMASSWQPEALRTQAVVARTYALHAMDQHAGDPWHLTAGTASQLYGGLDAETPASRQAAAETRGEYLAFDGRPLLAVFHAAAGGRTAAADEVWSQPVPYLQSQAVEGEEESPFTYWRAPVSRDEIATALAALGEQVGEVERLSVVERTESGRAARVRVRGRDATVEVRAADLRELLGSTRVRSTLFDVRPWEDGFVFVGSGSGHGVGLSQWGARAMVARGARHPEILARFFPGSTLRRVSAP
jgi:stage II sporulation protein D